MTTSPAFRAGFAAAHDTAVDRPTWLTGDELAATPRPRTDDAAFAAGWDQAVERLRPQLDNVVRNTVRVRELAAQLDLDVTFNGDMVTWWSGDLSDVRDAFPHAGRTLRVDIVSELTGTTFYPCVVTGEIDAAEWSSFGLFALADVVGEARVVLDRIYAAIQT